jgi:hypothetical protein
LKAAQAIGRLDRGPVDRSWWRGEGRASFLKKRSKKLFESGARAFSPARAQMIKIFFASFLFTKKKTLPLLPFY